jgi:hypothetical protein
MFHTGTKIYQKDGSSFFSWNRKISSNIVIAEDLKNTNKNGLGFKLNNVIDSSVRTQLKASHTIGLNSKNISSNKMVEQNSIKTGLRYTRNLGSAVPKKCSARTTNGSCC